MLDASRRQVEILLETEDRVELGITCTLSAKLRLECAWLPGTIGWTNRLTALEGSRWGVVGSSILKLLISKLDTEINIANISNTPPNNQKNK
jgi:hypothetical protein